MIILVMFVMMFVMIILVMFVMTKLMEIELVMTYIDTDVGHGDLLLITKSYRGEIKGDERY